MAHLERYHCVLGGKEKARFLLSKSVKVDAPSDVTDLMEWHDRYLSGPSFSIKGESKPGYSLLGLKVEIAERFTKECRLCENRCGVDRSLGKSGKCGVTVPRISSHFIHHGEEAPLVPSYTIFFSGCTYQCVFCQNHDISTNPRCGSEIPEEEMARKISELKPKGGASTMRARNVNWVGGEPAPDLAYVLATLLHSNCNIPQVWNSNMYMTEESMRLLDGTMDVFLSDFKFGNDDCAKRLCGVDNYFEVVSRNHLLATKQSEVIVRHLVLPGHLECCTKPILKWLAENLPQADVNVMGQYRPEHRAAEYPEQAKGLSRREYEEAFRFAVDLGLSLI